MLNTFINPEFRLSEQNFSKKVVRIKEVRLYCDDKKPEAIKFNFKMGDKVRITKLKNIFAKGYEPNWTQQVFVISEATPFPSCI